MHFDQEYVRRLIAGDREVENHFTVHFGHLILIALRNRPGCERWVDDVRQETFRRVLSKLRSAGGLHHAERLGAFVRRVCLNVLAEYLREEQRDGSTGNVPDTIDNREDLEEELINSERKRLVEKILAKLTPIDRDALRMVFLEERDRSEVCRILGIDREHLRVILHRARSRFKERLARSRGWTGLFQKKSRDR